MQQILFEENYIDIVYIFVVNFIVILVCRFYIKHTSTFPTRDIIFHWHIVKHQRHGSFRHGKHYARAEYSPKPLEYVRNYTSVRTEGIKVLSRDRQVGRRDIRSLAAAAIPLFPFLVDSFLPFSLFFVSLPKKFPFYMYVREAVYYIWSFTGCFGIFNIREKNKYSDDNIVDWFFVFMFSRIYHHPELILKMRL